MEIVIILVLVGLILASVWIVFSKAGEPGWAAIIPIYNYMVLARIAGKPEWWGLLILIPFVGIIFAFIILIEVAKSFGKGAGFGIGLALLGFIFFPILAFSDAQHESAGGRRSKRSVSRFDDDDDDDDDRPRGRGRLASRRDADDDDRPRGRGQSDDDDDRRRRRKADDDDDLERRSRDDDRPRRR